MHIPRPRQWAQQFTANWAVSSQLQARRNAMVASTVLAHRRAERLEVEEFLTSLEQSPTAPDTPKSDAAAHA